MRLMWSWRTVASSALVVFLSSLIWPGPAHAVTNFGGEATGVYVFVPTTGTIIKVTTGQIPAAGGEVEASLLVGDIPSAATGGAVALTAGTLHSVGVALDETDAIASESNVSLTVSGNGITADFLMARSIASCGPAPTVTGESRLENIVINGQTITVTGAPNQTIALPNGTATINEQTSSIVGTVGNMSVTALHVATQDTITGAQLADVKLAIGNAQIDCQAGSGPTGSSTSGGGWIPLTPSGKGTFGVIGAIQPDSTFMGHVVYIDHNTNFSVQSTSVTSFVPGCTSQIHGDGTSGATSVHWTVTVQDNGEPGSSDTFSIDVTDLTNFPIYSASGTLGGGAGGGGNIQAHRMRCP
jgi:hypothetical protein